MGGMRFLLLLLWLLFPLSASLLGQAAGGVVGPAPANTHAWEKVEALAPGDDITVTSARTGTLRCKFRSATGDALYCDTLAPIHLGSIGDRQYEFRRDEIVKVRHRHFPRDRNITIAAFAVLGCALGTPGIGAPGCVIGAVALGVFGAVAALIVCYWLPGNTVYENREASRKQPTAYQPQAGNPAYPLPVPAE
jgi:hypothetical protein